MSNLITNQAKFNEHEFSVYRRYICIAEYPGQKYELGSIREFRNEGHCVGEDKYEKTPVYRLLKWYEKRTFEEIFSIRHIQVSEYQNYWSVGDILSIDGFKINSDCLVPVVIGFKAGGHTVNLENCMPLEGYNTYKYRNKKAIQNKL